MDIPFTKINWKIIDTTIFEGVTRVEFRQRFIEEEIPGRLF